MGELGIIICQWAWAMLIVLGATWLVVYSGLVV